MAALCLLIILQDGTAICLILYDLCYVILYLCLPCHISSGILLPDTDVLKTLRPFRVNSSIQVLFSFFSNPQRTDSEAQLFLLLVRYQVVPLLADLPAFLARARTELGGHTLAEQIPKLSSLT